MCHDEVLSVEVKHLAGAGNFVGLDASDACSAASYWGVFGTSS